MLIDPADVIDTTVQVMLMRQSEQTRLLRISNYVRGKHDPPYIPKGVNAEYRWIAKRSKRNFLPLVIRVISQNLHVDGYRPTGQTTNQVLAPQTPQPLWEAFRANRMISRQHGVHRSVIKYGTAYVVVLPGTLSTDEEKPAIDVPVIRPASPRRLTALYADDVDDEWPQLAIEVRTVNLTQNKQRVYVSLYDERFRYIMAGTPGVSSSQQFSLAMADPGDPLLNGQAPVMEHGLGLCPVVRFQFEDDLDGEEDCQGEIEPLISIQDQINFDTFNLMITTQFAAFRQRYVAGMAPVDESGREAAPFRPGVDRVWAAEDPQTKFGEFGESQLAPYSTVREDGIRHMGTISQVPPYHLLGQLMNMSAEALMAARDGLDRKIEELQSIMTDSWRNVFRLTALASGDKDNWNDLFGTVKWRDTSARAFSATIDGLTKIAQMLGVPAQELWSRIPGVTAEDIAAWQLAAQREQAQQLVQQAVAANVQVQQMLAAGQAGAQLPAAAPGAAPGGPTTPGAATATPAGIPPGTPATGQGIVQALTGGTPPNPPKGPGGKPAP